MSRRRFFKSDGRLQARLVGQALKLCRERSKISQRQAGEKIRRERTRIYRMEWGHDEARVSELFALLLLYSDTPEKDIVEIFWKYAQVFEGHQVPEVEVVDDADQEPVAEIEPPPG